jgi:AraC family transcriptional regulator
MLTTALAPSIGPQMHAELRIGRLARLRRWTHDGAPTAAARPSAHPAVEIAWVEAGRVTYRIGGRSLEAPAGSVVIVPRDAEHTTVFGASVRAGALWVTSEMVDELGQALGRRGAARAVEPGRLEVGPEALSLARMLAAELAGGESGALIAAEALLEAIVVRVLRTAPLGRGASGASSPGIAAAVELVHARYAEPLGVDDLAREAGMSRFHFSRHFRREVGVSPYRFLLRVRVERAAELLRGGRHDVTQAALEVGFADLGRFARAFRAHFGCTPSRAPGRGRAIMTACASLAGCP